MRYLLFFLMLPLLGGAQTADKQAAEFYRQNKFALAVAECQKILKDQPNNLVVLELLGDAYAKQENWDQSKKQFEKLKSLRPKVADYQYKYGGAIGMIAKNSNKFKAMGMISEIRESFEQAIRLDKGHIGARWALIEFNLQLPAIVGGSIDQALIYAAQLQQLSPVDGHLAKGHISENQNKYSDAEKHYKAAIKVGNSKTTYNKLADLYIKMKQPEKAQAILKEFSARQTI